MNPKPALQMFQFFCTEIGWVGITLLRECRGGLSQFMVWVVPTKLWNNRQ
jgi:hypothetical protein